MMTTMVSSVGLDSRQMMPSMQFKANETTAAEELKAEEQQQADTVSTQKIGIIRSSADIRILQINQAAEAGLLRPMWVEMHEMDPDLPRTSDIIRRAGENKKDDKTERIAEDAKERFAKSEQAAAEAEERFAKSKQAASADGSEERFAKSRQAADADGAARTLKSERTAKLAAAYEAEQAAKSKQDASSSGSAVDLSE